MTNPLTDVQSRPDTRGIAIDEAGVRDLRYPIVVRDQARGSQHTIASVSMSVSVPAVSKGTHMSRFLEVLNKHHSELNIDTLPSVLAALRSRLQAESAHMEVRFPYFIDRAAPVTGSVGKIDYQCWMRGSSLGYEQESAEDYVIGVRTPVTSLCPCSKEISDYGAHNQRGYITTEVRVHRDAGTPQWLWFEELIAIAEAAASAPVYPLLKRPDERHVTMQAYDNPVFVEDMARNVAVALNADARVSWYRVEVQNEESIHNHAAYAVIDQLKEPNYTQGF